MGESRSYGSSWAFFVYDHSVIKREEDDLKDAILYFYPTTMDITDQCLFVGKLMGLAEFLSTCIAHSPPRVYQLEKHKFSLHRHGNYTFALASAPSAGDEQLVSRLHLLLDIFVTYQGSMPSLYQRSGKEEFLEELRQVWDSYLLWAHSFTDLVSMAFNAVPSISLPRTESRIFLQASHILQRAQKDPAVLAGVVIYKGRVLCTQLSPDVTRRLLILKPRQIHLPCIHLAVDFELPQSIRLLRIYIRTEEVSQLSPLKVSRLNKGDNYSTPRASLTSEGVDSTSFQAAAPQDLGVFTSAVTSMSLASVQSVVCHSGKDSSSSRDQAFPVHGLESSFSSSQMASPTPPPDSPMSHHDETVQVSTDFHETSTGSERGNEKTFSSGGGLDSQQTDGLPMDAEPPKVESSVTTDGAELGTKDDSTSVQGLAQSTSGEEEGGSSASQESSGVTVGDVSPGEGGANRVIPETVECDSSVQAKSGATEEVQEVRLREEEKERCEEMTMQVTADQVEGSDEGIAGETTAESPQPDTSSTDSQQASAGELCLPQENVDSHGRRSDQPETQTSNATSSCPTETSVPSLSKTSSTPGSHTAEEFGSKQDITQTGNMSSENSGTQDLISASDHSHREVLEKSEKNQESESSPSDAVGEPQIRAGDACDENTVKNEEKRHESVENADSVQKGKGMDASDVPSGESSDRNISFPEGASSQSSGPTPSPEQALCSDVERLAERLIENSDSDVQSRVAFTARKSIISLVPEPEVEEEVVDGADLITSSSSYGDRSLSPQDGVYPALISGASPAIKSPETSLNGSLSNHKFLFLPGTRSPGTSPSLSFFDPKVKRSSSRQEQAAAVATVGKALLRSAKEGQSEGHGGAEGTKKKEEEQGGWVPEEDGLVEVPLYVQGHQDTVIALMLRPDTDMTETFIYKLFRQALENISDLDIRLQGSPINQRTEMRSRDDFHFLRYDSFSSDVLGNTLDPVTRSDNTFVDACVSMHEIFQTQSEVSEMILKSGSDCCYGYKCFTHETFYNEETAIPRDTGGPSQLDPSWGISKRMRETLSSKKNIVVL